MHVLDNLLMKTLEIEIKHYFNVSNVFMLNARKKISMKLHFWIVGILDH